MGVLSPPCTTPAVVRAGERHGAAADRVAAAHSLRIVMVVGAIPFGVRWLTGHGWGEDIDSFMPPAATVRVPGLLLILLL